MAFESMGSDYSAYAYLLIADGPWDDVAPPPWEHIVPQKDDPLYSFDPEALTSRTGITPTESGRVGEVSRTLANGTKWYYRENWWKLRSSLEASEFPERHVANVLDKLQPSWAEFKKVCNQYACQLSIVTKAYGSDNPGASIRASDVTRLAELGASIDVDAYVSGDRDEEWPFYNASTSSA